MFGELPKLFDRNFAVGFFLPMAVFITASGLILGQYGFAPQVVNLFGMNLLVGTTTLGLVSWVGGIVLLAINRDLYRLMEGYGKYNPIQLFAPFQKNRYRKMKAELKTLDDEFKKCKAETSEFPARSRTRRNKLLKQLVDDFPKEEEHLLPTPFGNILRAFENYPLVMYGLESIGGWERLLAVIPKDYLELVDAAKAQVDFWLNLGLAFLLLLGEYAGLAFIFGHPINWWIVLLLILLGTIAPLRADSSAREWGLYVKAAFDMFLPKMREALGVVPPEDRAQEFAQWYTFSQATIFRKPKLLPVLKVKKEGEGKEEKKA